MGDQPRGLLGAAALHGFLATFAQAAAGAAGDGGAQRQPVHARFLRLLRAAPGFLAPGRFGRRRTGAEVGRHGRRFERAAALGDGRVDVRHRGGSGSGSRSRSRSQFRFRHRFGLGLDQGAVRRGGARRPQRRDAHLAQEGGAALVDAAHSWYLITIASSRCPLWAG
ncbi:hypothetical protein LP420_03510 [Massilia sp. B-10]|nr:hypothetical protein LP420_03510 [Massilia sp. B-10]